MCYLDCCQSRLTLLQFHRALKRMIGRGFETTATSDSLILVCYSNVLTYLLTYLLTYYRYFVSSFVSK